MNSEEDRSLIRLVLDLFKVPEASYNVYARYNDPDVKKRLLKHGFKVSPIVGTGTGAKPQLDTFNKQDHESEAKEQEYGGLIFNKGFSGCIHRRNELVIALLIVAASYCSLG